MDLDSRWADECENRLRMSNCEHASFCAVKLKHATNSYKDDVFLSAVKLESPV